MRHPIKNLKGQGQEIFATFDDGPCSQSTEKVLRQLSLLKVKATFFVIGASAQNHKSLIDEMVQEGHSIGNHSWDHAYGHYFHNKAHLKSWVLDSQSRLQDLLGFAPVAFRSPAGIVTPPLKQAMAELDIPWVHWNRRFFDTNVPLSWGWGRSTFQQGDILLMHDKQRPLLLKSFLNTMAEGFAVLQDKGFDFQALRAEKFINAN